ncbi:unnamed protein product [Linum tenue]|uniref:Uncharacterized protein n=1 Tax=Linum tenue TaxID=586396 RepID=A0AAV0LVA2_9ROSI|nr:unnamed protein product [Linum tenue]
MRWKEGGN